MPDDRDPAPPAQSPDVLLVGRYRVGRLLGQGAHGAVHLAEDYGRGGQQVALKLVKGQADAGGWREEAALALHWFRHPNWADVLDAGFLEEGAWFQSLRYVQGQSLAALEEPLDAGLVWQFLEDSARVLQALHGHGLIHYDVTPGNFILEEAETGPRFVLTDGGLAHLGPVEGSTRGTPLYLAPELMDEQPHDHRIDLYSLGLVAFRLATGREPFGSDVDLALPLRKRQSAPRARSIHPHVPPELDEVIARLLARRPDKRPQSGGDLLRSIAAATGRDIPALRKEEAYAAADGGCIVGRTEAMDRFFAVRLQISSALAILRAKTNGFTVSGINEPVLLLSGDPGAGSTRLAREMIHKAQAAEIPVLLIAGRDGAPNPQAPLDLLFEALGSLGSDRAPKLDSGPRPERGGGNRRERAYAKQRTVEQFLRLAHATARRAPFVLAVEDLQELPELAQAAIQALARDLMSRAEHGPDRAAPPLLLLVDVGAADLAPFLIPDSETPNRPVVTVPPLTREEVHDVCTQAFPGLSLPEGDLETVHQTCAGLPGALVALLGEAASRGDLSPVDDGWAWDVSTLSSYEVNKHLPAHLASALRHAETPLRALLTYLALCDSPLDREVIRDLWSPLSDGPIPATALLTTRRGSDSCRYALSSTALRNAILESCESELDARRKELLTRLERHPSADTVIDRVRLYLDTGSPRAAIELLAAQWEGLNFEERFSAQAFLRQAIDLEPQLAQEPASRSTIAHLLERGPDAVQIATSFVDLFPVPVKDLAAVIQVAEVLEDADQVTVSLQLLDRHQDAPDAPAAQRCLVNVRRALLAQNQNKQDVGRAAFKTARVDYKRLAKTGKVPSILTAEYLRVRAGVRFSAGGNVRKIEILLREADSAARSVKALLLRAQISNNLGLTMVRAGEMERAREYLRRSLRLKKTLGDFKGVATSTLNLARTHLRSGEVLSATRYSIDCVHRTQRYGLRDTQISALRLLADAYDRQHRPTLALDTLLRAWRMARAETTSKITGRVGWDLAPLAAAVGRSDIVRQSLQATASLAREDSTLKGARGRHFLTAAIAHLHLGQRHLYRRSLSRVLRRSRSLTREDQWITGFLAHLEQLDAGVTHGLLDGARSHNDPPMRYLYRIVNWYRRVLREQPAPPIPGLTGVRGSGARGIPSGTLGRLASEFLLMAAQVKASSVDEEALAQVQSYAGLSDAALLQSRALAVRSIQRAPKGDWSQAQHFSQSIALLEQVRQSAEAKRQDSVPDEVLFAAQELAQQLRIPTPQRPELRDLHALAHQAVVRPGAGGGRRPSESGVLPNERLAVALRHVLEASARMRGANGVRDLIASITKHTIDITGAQRACVVLREADSDMEISESASVWDSDGDVELRDVSNTVIHKVLETQTPIFRPYVIEDEGLLESSSSIRNLGLLSILCVPLRRRGALYGVLYADSTAVGAFEPVDVEVLSLFADQAAAAIETSRLIEDVQRSFAELKAMQDRLVRGERLRVIGELSSGVAHEFNNLLTAILARIQMMGLNYLPPEARRDLELIEKAALDAAAVVRRLQSFSRSQRQADFTMVDVGEVCRDAVDLLRPLWRKRSRPGRGPVNVQLRTEPDLIVQGDPTELREVVTNVLKNAIDSIVSGGRVTVSARRQRGQIHLRIRDNGSGIPADILTKIFDPFYTTKGERGTGLGLSLSQQIVDQHGGSISIDSKEDSGTTVSVLLPAAEPGVARPPAKPEDAGVPHEALRVVVVDDDSDVLKSLCTYLERSGYDVISASNGADGLEKTLEHEPDVVLTDVSMPGMDGIELCRKIHEAKPHLPIVLMSGWASDLNHASAREAGARDVLSKPFEMPEVTRLLAEVADTP